MPAESFTYTTFDVYERVRTLFGDTSGAQITDAMVTRWINDGQQEIVNNNPILKDTKYSDIVAGQGEYTFPNDKVQYIEAIYVDGRPVRAMTPQTFREFILQDDPRRTAKSDYPDVWYERNGLITFYPTPQKDFPGGLKLEYVRQPTPVTFISTSVNLSIPDRYLNELVNFVMSQALELDENFTAADYKRNQFREGLDRQHLRENIVQIASYPQVMPDPDDYLNV
jgi:hypothetical protein